MEQNAAVVQSDQNAAVVQSFRSLYLNPDRADVWFTIDGVRIPAHKLILSASSPYYKTMFYGSIPENVEIDLSASNISLESFQEFLKFLYILQPELTVHNISEVLFLAKQSLSDEIFAACEAFLIKSLSMDNIFLLYQLAFLYDANHLKDICEEEICVHAEMVLKSSSFLEFPYDLLLSVLKRDALACEEVDIFNACIAWAKAACERIDSDGSKGQLIREQLRDAMYQIRFTSMTKVEVGKCIRLCRGLFTVDELEEIVCMAAHQDQFQTKKFNWTPRYFDLEWYKGRLLEFSRAESHTNMTRCDVNEFESTKVWCNRKVLLKEIWCEISQRIQTPMNIIIMETKNNEDPAERYDQQTIARFVSVIGDMYQAKIPLNKAILLRPKCIYEICTIFEGDRHSSTFEIIDSSKRYSNLALKKRVDHDIVFNFDNNGIVSGLTIYRFDERNYCQKVVHNPKTWMILGGLALLFVCHAWKKPNLFYK